MSTRQGVPQLVTIHDSAKACTGHTLFGTSGSKDLWLINMQGQFVHHWQRPYSQGSCFKLLPNGNVLVTVRVLNGPMVNLGGSGGELAELDWDSNLVWKYRDLSMNAHEFDRMENGNTLIACRVPIPNEIAAKVKEPSGLPGSFGRAALFDRLDQPVMLQQKKPAADGYWRNSQHFGSCPGRQVEGALPVDLLQFTADRSQNADPCFLIPLQGLGFCFFEYFCHKFTIRWPHNFRPTLQKVNPGIFKRLCSDARQGSLMPKTDVGFKSNSRQVL